MLIFFLLSGVEGLQVGFPSLYNAVFVNKYLASKNHVEPGNGVIEGIIEEEALKSNLRLKANRNWIQMPLVNTIGKLTSHTKILDMIINAIPLSKEDQDSMTTTYNLDLNFFVDIPTKKDYNKEVKTINHKLDENITGAGVFKSTTVIITLPKRPFILAKQATVFQAKVLH